MYPHTERVEITNRWIARNAEKRAQGCPCGKPATKVMVDRSNAFCSDEPIMFFYCDEHVGVNTWQGDGSGHMVPMAVKSYKIGEQPPLEASVEYLHLPVLPV